MRAYIGFDFGHFSIATGATDYATDDVGIKQQIGAVGGDIFPLDGADDLILFV